jgi:hypothetical protein
LLELDDGSSGECGEHGGCQLVGVVRLAQLSVHQGCLSVWPCRSSAQEKLAGVGVGVARLGMGYLGRSHDGIGPGQLRPRLLIRVRVRIRQGYPFSALGCFQVVSARLSTSVEHAQAVNDLDTYTITKPRNGIQADWSAQEYRLCRVPTAAINPGSARMTAAVKPLLNRPCTWQPKTVDEINTPTTTPLQEFPIEGPLEVPCFLQGDHCAGRLDRVPAERRS